MDYQFRLKGTTPLLMHADDVEASDRLSEWRKKPANKSLSVPGDDRSPAWTWTAYVYHDAKHLAMPQETLMAALRYAGAKIPSKGKSTFKSMSQSGLLISSDYCTFLVDGEPISFDWIARLASDDTIRFSDHVNEARKHGFDLSVKRAAVGKAKHVRVRPRFDTWEVHGQIRVSEAAITRDVLTQLFEIAGRLAGLGDWRPSAPSKPGPFGMFDAEILPAKGR